MTTDSIADLIKSILENDSLILATLSSPKESHQSTKILIRPLTIKDKIVYQLTEQRGTQAFHKNLSIKECEQFLNQHIVEFKQSFLFTSEADYQILVGKKQNVKIIKNSPSKSPLKIAHNRKKEYLLEENTPIPFLIELDIMSASGKVHAQKRDKFKQINRFLEMVDDVLTHFDQKTTIRIVDFGCGKSYLTFALYYYLTALKGFQIELTGIDLKESVIQACEKLAKKLDYKHLHFIVGDINDYRRSNQVDMVVSLHACDTATDAALEKAVHWQAKVILCVPCCQHELFKQIQNEALSPLLKHGILKERFAALATDAARAQILEALGYRVQVLEFIDMEHTPKNLLIRAVKMQTNTQAEKAWESYRQFKQELHIYPTLEKRFT